MRVEMQPIRQLIVAVLFLATGTAQAQSYRGPTTANDPMYKVDPDTAVVESLLPTLESLRVIAKPVKDRRPPQFVRTKRFSGSA